MFASRGGRRAFQAASGVPEMTETVIGNRSEIGRNPFKDATAGKITLRLD